MVILLCLAGGQVLLIVSETALFVHREKEMLHSQRLQ